MIFTKENTTKHNKTSWSEKAIDKRKCTQLNKQFLSAYKNLIELGMSKEDITAIFGMGRRNRAYVEANNPDITIAYEEAMDVLEAKLATRMIKQAIGYNYTEIDVSYSYNPKTKKWTTLKKTRRQRHQPGNAQIFMYFMSNNYGDHWKDMKETVIKKEGYDSSPSKRVRSQIVSLARDVLEANTEQPKLVKGNDNGNNS